MVQAGPRASPEDDGSGDTDRGDIEDATDEADSESSTRNIDLVARPEGALTTSEIPDWSDQVEDPEISKIATTLSDSVDGGETSATEYELKNTIRPIELSRRAKSSKEAKSGRQSIRRAVLALLGLLIVGSAFLAFRSQTDGETDAAQVDEQSVIANFDPDTSTPSTQSDNDGSASDGANESSIEERQADDPSTEDQGAASSDLEDSPSSSTTMSEARVSEPVGGSSTETADTSIGALGTSTARTTPTTSRSRSNQPTTSASSPTSGDRSITTRATTAGTQRITVPPTTTRTLTTRRSTTTAALTTRRTTTRLTTTKLTTTRLTTTTRATTTTRLTTTRPPSTIAGSQVLTNSGFELSNVPAGVRRNVTTPSWWSNNGTIEVWGTGYNGVGAVSGSHLVALSSDSRGRIQQQVNSTPGATYQWSLFHRGLDEQESVEILLDGRTVATLSSSSTWTRHTGELVILPGRTSIIFGVRAVDDGGGVSLIDAVGLARVTEP